MPDERVPWKQDYNEHARTADRSVNDANLVDVFQLWKLVSQPFDLG